MTCPYLCYRSSDGEYDFDHERPYCAVEEQFVSPMRADICNARYGFAPDTHCDIYRRVTERGPVTSDTHAESVD